MDVRAQDDVTLYAEQVGAGPDVLLIHGSASALAGWTDVMPSLSETCRVTAYDRRAYGKSGGDPTPDNQVHARDAASVMRGAGIERATVVGWSRGGAVALELALAEPDLVERLVLVEPAFLPAKHLDRSVVRMVLGMHARKRINARAATEKLVRRVGARRDGSSPWDEDAFGEQRRETVLSNTPAIVGEWALRQPERLTTERVAQITQPTTVLVGEESVPWFERMATTLVGAMPNAALVRVPRGSHAFVYTAGEALIEHIRDVVAQPVAG